MMTRACNVLLVDDSEDDVFLLKRALAPHTNLRVVAWAEDGNGAIDYLSGTGPFADRKQYPWPDIMVLDLKMPRRDGYDVLEWMRGKSPRPKIVVFTASDLEEDRTRVGTGSRSLPAQGLPNRSTQPLYRSPAVPLPSRRCATVKQSFHACKQDRVIILEHAPAVSVLAAEHEKKVLVQCVIFHIAQFEWLAGLRKPVALLLPMLNFGRRPTHLPSRANPSLTGNRMSSARRVSGSTLQVVKTRRRFGVVLKGLWRWMLRISGWVAHFRTG